MESSISYEICWIIPTLWLDPSKDFDAHDDFFVFIVSCHNISAALAALEIKFIHDTPSGDVSLSAENTWIQSADDRRVFLDQVCKQVIDSFYSWISQLNRTAAQSDWPYHRLWETIVRGRLHLPWVLQCSWEGDGKLVLCCWHQVTGSGHMNYTCEVMNMLFQHSYSLSSLFSAELTWSCFVNVHGPPGKNIPADRHMEHLNRLALMQWRILVLTKLKRHCQELAKHGHYGCSSSAIRQRGHH